MSFANGSESNGNISLEMFQAAITVSGKDGLSTDLHSQVLELASIVKDLATVTKNKVSEIPSPSFQHAVSAHAFRGNAIPTFQLRCRIKESIVEQDRSMN
ncbi:hypothetical protein CBL_08382 [Carabus blaptoides fortunei]